MKARKFFNKIIPLMALLTFLGTASCSKGPSDEGQQHRLLDLHHASLGAFKGSRKMSHLLDGSRASDEGERNPDKFQ